MEFKMNTLGLIITIGAVCGFIGVAQLVMEFGFAVDVAIFAIMWAVVLLMGLLEFMGKGNLVTKIVALAIGVIFALYVVGALMIGGLALGWWLFIAGGFIVTVGTILSLLKVIPN